MDSREGFSQSTSIFPWQERAGLQKSSNALSSIPALHHKYITLDFNFAIIYVAIARVPKKRKRNSPESYMEALCNGTDPSTILWACICRI
jgi:hypothetical protein